MAGYTITVDDLRGEYWLYKEGELSVSIGCGRSATEGLIINTSDTFPNSDTLTLKQLATILGRFLKEFAPTRGRLTLYVDGRFALTEEHLRLIDKILTKKFSRTEARPGVFTWSR